MSENDTLQKRVLARAKVLCGGIHSLAEELGVSARRVDSWLTGAEALPQEAFLKAVDIVVTHDSLGASALIGETLKDK